MHTLCSKKDYQIVLFEIIELSYLDMCAFILPTESEVTQKYLISVMVECQCLPVYCMTDQLQEIKSVHQWFFGKFNH